MSNPPSWGRSPMPSSRPVEPSPDWAAWPMPSLYELLLNIQRHLGMLEGRQEAEARETRRHLSEQDVALHEIKDRLAAVERRPTVHIVDPPSQAPSPIRRGLSECRAFLGAVASPREWFFGAILVGLALKGIIEPEIARRWLFGVIGLPPA